MVIKLMASTSKIPDGVKILKVSKVEYKADFGKLKIFYEDKDGNTDMEQFSFLKNSGEVNEGALKAFSFRARVILDDFDIEEVDHEDLIGKYFKAKVSHVDDKYLKLDECGSATSFDDKPIDLDSLFDDDD